MPDGSALPLLVWLSPAFPVGSFAYSHGLEWAHESGDVTDLASCRDWIADILVYGSGRSDAILLAEAHRATSTSDQDGLIEIAELALALQPTAERFLESTTQGRSFLAIAQAAWPSDALAFFKQFQTGDCAYPIAVGVATAGYRMVLIEVLEAFLLAFVSNLVSASVRLGAIGQTDAQRIIAALMPLIRDGARAAEASTVDDLGSSAFRSDLASAFHETQYTRLFRS